ncbi:MAG: hypothetical protein ACFFCW_06815 [Candidatus Hodarchaeota archaeon]
MEFQASETTLIVRPVIVSAFSPPALACIRSWGKQKFQVGMVCIGSGKEAMPDSTYLAKHVMLPPQQLHTTNGIQVIDKFLREFRATGIICIDEKIACWFNSNRHRFPPGVDIWLPHNDVIRDMISKRKQIEVAHKVGFQVLPTYLIDRNGLGINKVLTDHYPLCLRPDNPAKIKPTFKVKLIYSEAELKEFIETLQKINCPVIAQPFMNLPNLVVHGARTTSGTSIGLQGFLVERKFEGITLTIRPTRLSSELRTKCIDFTNHFKLTGNYHFEFLTDKATDLTYFLEINNRLGGTTAKVYACGYDEPLLALQAYGVKGKNEKQMRNTVVSNKQALVKYLLYTIKGRLTPLDYPNERKPLKLLKTMYGFFKYKDEVLSFRDIRGSFALYLGNLRSYGQA